LFLLKEGEKKGRGKPAISRSNVAEPYSRRDRKGNRARKNEANHGAVTHFGVGTVHQEKEGGVWMSPPKFHPSGNPRGEEGAKKKKELKAAQRHVGTFTTCG